MPRHWVAIQIVYGRRTENATKLYNSERSKITTTTSFSCSRQSKYPSRVMKTRDSLRIGQKKSPNQYTKGPASYIGTESIPNSPNDGQLGTCQTNSELYVEPKPWLGRPNVQTTRAPHQSLDPFSNPTLHVPLFTSSLFP